MVDVSQVKLPTFGDPCCGRCGRKLARVLERGRWALDHHCNPARDTVVQDERLDREKLRV